jgi:hypothetical protein
MILPVIFGNRSKFARADFYSQVPAIFRLPTERLLLSLNGYYVVQRPKCNLVRSKLHSEYRVIFGESAALWQNAIAVLPEFSM